MKQVRVRRINGKIYPSDYVGITNVVDGINIRVIYFDSEYGELTIEVDQYGNGLYKCQERISLAFGEELLIDKMKSYFYIETIIEDGIDFSANAINSLDNILKMGCSSLIYEEDKKIASKEDKDIGLEDSYEVSIFATNDDGVFKFPCTFLSEDEKHFIANKIKSSRSYQNSKLKNSIKISSFIK